MKLLIAGAALSAAVCFAPNASATPDQYLNYLHDAGYESANGDTGLVNAGYATCMLRRQGYSKIEVAGKLQAANPKIGTSAAMEIVEAAYQFLCPMKGMSS